MGARAALRCSLSDQEQLGAPLAACPAAAMLQAHTAHTLSSCLCRETPQLRGHKNSFSVAECARADTTWASFKVTLIPPCEASLVAAPCK